jgi:hypothetical protein
MRFFYFLLVRLNVVIHVLNIIDLIDHAHQTLKHLLVLITLKRHIILRQQRIFQEY